MAEHRDPLNEPPRPPGPPTGLTCPECHGALWSVEDDRYQCRVGHAYSEDALVSAQGESVEAALWTALEVLEERAELLDRIAERHGERRPRSRSQMQRAAGDARSRADLLRRALAAGPSGGPNAFDVAEVEAAG
jgi:two-component system chemotaxis response regulator CheB